MYSDASIANKTISTFLSRLPRVRSDIVPPKQSRQQFMQDALKRLADFTEDPSIAERNPLSALSFSCLPEQIVNSQAESLAFFGKDQWKAFNPLKSDGRPIRR